MKYVTLQIDQPHLGLPSRGYYLNERSKNDLGAYHKYMTEVSLYSYSAAVAIVHFACS